MALAQKVPDAIADDHPERARIQELASQFSPEDIQLCYQISLLGRRDLGLAPDEYAGFTMCLLRMLAFAPGQPPAQGRPTETKPDTAPPQAVVLPTAAKVSPAPQKAETTNETSRAAQQAAAPAKSSAPPAPAFEGNWRALVDQLKLGGMARMLAQNCELTHFDELHMVLSVPHDQKHLLDNIYQDKLRASLREHFGNKLQVRIELGGNAEMNTPAQQIGKEKAEQQAQAESAIRSDKFVRDLMSEFGATIVPSSIKPV